MKRRLLAIVLVGAFVVAGCGDNGDVSQKDIDILRQHIDAAKQYDDGPRDASYCEATGVVC